MRKVEITRQLIRSISLNTRMITAGEIDVERQVRSSAMDDDDYRSPWERGWRVVDVKILSQFEDPRNDRLSELAQHNRMTKVYALITETKTETIPESTEEEKR